ncbi:MAG: heme A synthase [Microscillaceae bacterium]|nr:heme A synthase [Microscillaceae bacterium]
MSKRSFFTNNSAVIFRNLGITTIFSVYLLILIGGVVRSTGSGMGCPDWPKCFGQWIPPTEVSSLPLNYKEIYAQKRKEKNYRLATMLENWGMKETAQRLRGDAQTYEEADFNALKTWIEYINRLVGVLIGFFIFLTFLFSFAYRKTRPLVTWSSFLAFVLVGVQGWIGSVVVSTNLLPGLISLHMLLAIVIVSILIYAVLQGQPPLSVSPDSHPARLKKILLVAMALTLVQVLMGTQVREGIDLVAKTMGWEARAQWVWQIGSIFYVHRSFSWLLLLAHAYLIWQVFKAPAVKEALWLRKGHFGWDFLFF